MSRIKIGWSKRDISTDMPVPMIGQAYLRISEGVMDPIMASCLVLDSGDDCVIFLSYDSEGCSQYVLEDVRNMLKEKCPEIPGDKITMNATHAHTGAAIYPGNVGFSTGDPQDDLPCDGMEITSSEVYLEWLRGVLVDMILEAWNGREEGGIAYGYGYAVVGHSRRVCYFDDVSLRDGNANTKTNTYGVNGHSVMYGNTDDDKFSHYEAGADHFENLLYTFDKDNKLTGAIINIPCPSQNSESEWLLTSDYWHDVRKAIAEKYGDIFILPQCAAGGDLSPRILHYKKAQARRFNLKYGIDTEAANRSRATELCARKDIAERVTDAFTEVLDWAKKDIMTEVKIGHKTSTVMLSRWKITDEEYEYAKLGLAEARAKGFVHTGDAKQDFIVNSTSVSNRNRCLKIIKRYETQETDPKQAMELHVLRVGNIAFATNGYELYMDFQHRIQARSPFEQTFIVQLANQFESYICTDRALEGKGYSAMIYSNQVSPEGGQELVEETLKQLKELYNE